MVNKHKIGPAIIVSTIVIVAVSLTLFYKTRASRHTPDTPYVFKRQPEVDAVLARYNAFRLAHPNLWLETNIQGDIRGLSTSYILDRRWLIHTEIAKPIKFTTFQYPGEGESPLTYFPVSKLAVPEDDPFSIYILTELAWDKELDAEKLAKVEGEIEVRKQGAYDHLTITFPGKSFARGKADRGDIVIQYDIDETGKIAHASSSLDNMTFTGKYNYVSFDAGKIKTEMSRFKLKPAPDKELKYEDALAKEIQETFTKNLLGN